mgnify:CR=1 FL=1
MIDIFYHYGPTFRLLLECFFLLMWIIMLITVLLLINGNYIPDKKVVFLVVQELQPHSSSHKVCQDHHAVNITAYPVLDNVVWEKVLYQVIGPTE